MTDRLHGRVVVIGARDEDARTAALTVAGEGAAVVLIADATAHAGVEATAGEIARDVTDAGGRAAVFVGSLTSADDRDALAEMLAELF